MTKGDQNPKDSSGVQAMPPLLRKSMESGLICMGAVGEDRLPESAVGEVLNMHFDTIGVAKLRPGNTALGNNMTTAITGLYYYVDTVAGTNTQLMAVTSTKVKYLSAGTWTDIRTSLTSGSKARFSTFLNYVFMVNTTEATAVWDGNTGGAFSTVGNAASAPTGGYIENFRSRMWIAGNTTYPDRLYFSTVPSDVTTPILTWDTSVTTGQWIDISPSDGENITALQRYRNVMLVFKQHHIYRVFDINQTDADPYWYVGTFSQESVVESKGGIFFHDASGIYNYNVYGVVQEISRPVLDYIRAIPYSQYTKITGWLEADGDHMVWAIGTVTVNGITITSCELRYTISTQIWTVYSKPTTVQVSTRRPPFYQDGTTRFVLVGDGNGNVMEVATGLTDVNSAGTATPITYSLTHRWENIDGLLSTRKNLMIVNFSHTGGAGSNVSYQTEKNDPDALTDWSKKVGQLQARNTGLNSVDIKARKIRMRISGVSSGQPFTYRGYELLEVLNEFITFDKE